MRRILILLICCGLISAMCPYVGNSTKSEIKPKVTPVTKSNNFSLSLSHKVTPIVIKTPIITQKPTIIPTPIVTPTLTSTATPKATPTIKPTKKPSPSAKPTTSNQMTFKVSAYDLSVESCGKARSHKYFGKTRSGFNLANKSRTDAMTIAADLNILPMGTKVYITFKNSRVRKYDGVYTVRDTGGAIHGHKLDLYMGDNAYQQSMDFGVQKAYVRVIK